MYSCVTPGLLLETKEERENVRHSHAESVVFLWGRLSPRKALFGPVCFGDGAAPSFLRPGVSESSLRELGPAGKVQTAAPRQNTDFLLGHLSTEQSWEKQTK